jgi:hypothetical protein
VAMALHRDRSVLRRRWSTTTLERRCAASTSIACRLMGMATTLGGRGGHDTRDAAALDEREVACGHDASMAPLDGGSSLASVALRFDGGQIQVRDGCLPTMTTAWRGDRGLLAFRQWQDSVQLSSSSVRCEFLFQL